MLLLHTLQWKLHVRTCTSPVIRKFYLLKNTLAYCGNSPISLFSLLLSEHKHCDNAATNSNSKNARSRTVESLQGSSGYEDNGSQVLGAYGLLDFTIVQPVLAWRAFWNLWTVYVWEYMMCTCVCYLHTGVYIQELPAEGEQNHT